MRMTAQRPAWFIAAAFAAALLAAGGARAELPPTLPGEEITGDMLRRSVPAESIETATPPTAPAAATWLDESMKSWDAPTLSEQMASDETPIPIGKGAVFIPTLTKPTLEPDIEVVDSAGRLVANGKTGRRYAMLPGRYYVMLGSGAYRQRMVRTVNIAEGATVPLIPNWSGLSIEVVNRDGIPWRGAYEIACVDNYQPYGRFYGPDPSLGEESRTMILPAGLYKIIAPGESYNTLKNFVTVLLLPGRQTRFLLTIDTVTGKTANISGGVVESNLNQAIDRNWKYGVDLGGSVAFTASSDAMKKSKPDRDAYNTTATILLNAWLRYQRTPLDWNTNFRIEEWPSISWAAASQFNLSRVTILKDEVRLPSLLIWRIFPWAGPYGRFETRTTVFPRYATLDKSESTDRFYLYDPSDGTGRTDSGSGILIQQSFSPLTIETGVGANFDIVSVRLVESKFRIGFGYKLDHLRAGYSATDPIPLSVQTRDSLLLLNSYTLSHTDEKLTQNAGPEAALNLDLRLGDFALARSELKVFMPVAPQLRLDAPDMEWRPSISWIITRAISMDYQYSYLINHDLKTELMQHAVILRFSFSSR